MKKDSNFGMTTFSIYSHIKQSYIMMKDSHMCDLHMDCMKDIQYALKCLCSCMCDTFKLWCDPTKKYQTLV